MTMIHLLKWIQNTIENSYGNNDSSTYSNCNDLTNCSDLMLDSEEDDDNNNVDNDNDDMVSSSMIIIFSFYKNQTQNLFSTHFIIRCVAIRYFKKITFILHILTKIRSRILFVSFNIWFCLQTSEHNFVIAI